MKFLYLFVLSWFFYCSLSAQSDSAQWVMQNYLEASGGKTLWDTSWSVRIAGVETSREGGYTGNAEEATRFFISTSTIDGDTYKKKVDSVKTVLLCFREEISYMHILKEEDTIHYEVNGLAKEKLREANGNFAPLHSIINQDETFQNASYGGAFTSGEQSWWLVVFHRDDNEVMWFVNTSTHLLDRIEDSEGMEITNSGYKNIQGRIRPTQFITKKKDKVIHEMRINEMRYNVDLPVCTQPHDDGY